MYRSDLDWKYYIMKKPIQIWYLWEILPYEGLFMMFNTTFNNILVILWWSFLLVEETVIPRENHRQTLSHIDIMLYRVHLAEVGFKLIMLVMIGTDCYDHDHDDRSYIMKKKNRCMIFIVNVILWKTNTGLIFTLCCEKIIILAKVLFPQEYVTLSVFDFSV
jgi:hypothetical protein